ncbi:hypothetical protein H0H93_016701, partial [Arthromyces matolae]
QDYVEHVYQFKHSLSLPTFSAGQNRHNMLPSYLISLHLTVTAIFIAIASPIPSTSATPGLINTNNIANDKPGSTSVGVGDPVRDEPFVPTQHSNHDEYLCNTPGSVPATAGPRLSDKRILAKGDPERENTKRQKKEPEKMRKVKLDDTTITFPEWLIDILSRHGIHQSNMELPPLSDENGRNRLETWLHALFYCIDATYRDKADKQKRTFMLQKLKRFRRDLQEQFWFTPESFARCKVLAIPKTMPSTESLTPPFLGKTEQSASDTNAIPSAQGTPPSFPDFDFNNPHPVPPTSDVPIPLPIPASHPHDPGPGYPKAGHTKEKRIVGQKFKVGDRTVLLPQWIKDILISDNNDQSSMELPLPSDRNGCDRLGTWLNALHYYIDVTNTSNPKNRAAMRNKLYRFREILRDQFGFTVRSFARFNKSDREVDISSELVPPFPSGQTEHLGAGDKSTISPMDPASHSADHTKEKRIKKVRGGGKSNLEHADRTLSLPKWIKDILIPYGIHESTMQLPLPSDQNGCDRLANWLNALHNYVDMTNPGKLHINLQTKLYRFRGRLRDQFGFTAQSFERRKRMARHEVIPSELIPPFSGGQTDEVAAGDKNTAPSSSATPHISPHSIVDQPGNRPTDPASNSAQITPPGAPTLPEHNQLGNSNGPEATSAARPNSKQPIMPSSSTFNDMIAANQDPHLIEMLKDVDEYTALHPSQDVQGASMQHNSDRPAPPTSQYDPEIPVNPELMNEEDDWNKYFNFER